MKIGIAEIIVICVIALVALGPEKLPIYAKKLGASLKEVKKVTICPRTSARISSNRSMKRARR